MNLSAPKALLSALIIGLSVPACSKSDTDAADIGSMSVADVAQMTNNLSASKAAKLAQDILGLAKGEISIGENGNRAAAVNQILIAKGFDLPAGNTINEQSLSALSLIKAAQSGNTAGSDAGTLQALITLPNSRQFSLFSLESYLMPAVNNSFITLPAKISISGEEISRADALFLAYPVLDSLRSGGSISTAELIAQAKQSKSHAAALSLITIAVDNAVELPPELVALKNDFSNQGSSLKITPANMAMLEKSAAFLNFDWQSVGSGTSIKTLFLELTREDRIANNPEPTYLRQLEQVLKWHFKDKASQQPAKNISELFSSFF